ncbi:dihydroorotase [Helicobacter felis]|uniref:Dihydroorotase n=1 Tax=Helicobacter felis (strain ATCC 49179 / CCUG 28539 / NCTC 12436 / CS1) TaxID=936155 RepID=E7ACH1_HELFC|nr:dihydroorotase [Helicobacter felis]CBY82200.1 dihydroorotase [Helicobacter felis ATCC 49179]
MITLHNPLDMHLHLREGDLLKQVLPFSAKCFSGAVVMPNLTTPITNTTLALEYAQEIQGLSHNFTPFVALYLQESLSENELKKAHAHGLFLLKLYPKNATTNSSSGVANILSPSMLKILSIAEELGFILCVHAESGGFVLEREVEFHPILHTLAKRFPRLTIILEHMSDARSRALLDTYPNLYATLTLQHISYSLDDLVGGALNPHLFCKPLLKTPHDQATLLDLALKAHPKVCFGSDSAPHSIENKHACACAAGVFSAPILLEALTTLFDAHHALDKLQAFISDNALRIYNLPKRVTLPQKSITLSKIPTSAPQIPELLVPHFPLKWRVDA